MVEYLPAARAVAGGEGAADGVDRREKIQRIKKGEGNLPIASSLLFISGGVAMCEVLSMVFGRVLRMETQKTTSKNGWL
jgi:hypothetical protein